jgi:hypothetical protein
LCGFSPRPRSTVARLITQAQEIQHLGSFGFTLRHLLTFEQQLRRELGNMTCDAIETFLVQCFDGMQGLQPCLPLVFLKLLAKLITHGVRVEGFRLSAKFL